MTQAILSNPNMYLESVTEHFDFLCAKYGCKCNFIAGNSSKRKRDKCK